MDRHLALLTDVKAAVITASATMLTSFAVVLEWLPSKAPAFAGFVLSVVLIYTHLRKGGLERERLQLQIDEMKRSKYAEDEKRVRARRFAGSEGVASDRIGAGPFGKSKAKGQD